MNQSQAEALARAAWGSAGWAREHRSYTGNEKPDSNGWVYPAGPVHGYSIGYYRKGKRGARLSTTKGSSILSFAAAVEDAINTTRGQRCHDKLAVAYVIKHGPWYPGTRTLLSTTDMDLPKYLYMAARFVNAEAFTCVRFKGRGLYATTRYATFAEACADAATDGRGMVYVIHDGTRSDMLPRTDWWIYRALAEQVARG